MLPNDICRTCALHDGNLLALSTRTDKYANKSFQDMLHELTQNDVSCRMWNNNTKLLELINIMVFSP